jgi:TPR repeat protein
MKRYLVALVVCLIAIPVAAQDFQTGVKAYGKGDYATAVRVFKAHADQGDAAAQFNIGFMYRKGYGVGKNDATAIKWLRMSAEQGFKQAQQSLIFMYTNGVGVTKSHLKAAYWKGELERAKAPRIEEEQEAAPRSDAEISDLRAAAQAGDTTARVELASLYASGNRMPQDFVKAHAWYNLAAAQGDQNASKKRDEIAGKMTPGDISLAQKLAAELAKTSGSDNN